MNKIKYYILLYILYVYDLYLYQEWDDITLSGKILLKPFWYIKILYVTLYSIVCFPLVLFHIYTKTNKKWISFWDEFYEFAKKELNHLFK